LNRPPVEALKARFIQRWYVGQAESRFQRCVLDTHANSFSDPNRDSYTHGNCNSNAYGYTHDDGETYANPEDCSHAKNSADARTAPMISYAILYRLGTFWSLGGSPCYS
jgi:hypothetical protein